MFTFSKKFTHKTFDVAVSVYILYSMKGFVAKALPVNFFRPFSETSDGRWRRCTCRPQRRKKNNLIEAAPFGRLNQMLSTIV